MSEDSTSSDERQTLLTSARNGDDSSLWRLCDDIRPRLRAMVAQRLGKELAGKVDPSDVVQDALTAAVRAFWGFNGQSIEEWEAWLVQIVKNEVRDARRFWHQSRRSVQREGVRLDEPGGPGLDPGGGSRPSERMRRDEESQRLLAMLGRLPPDEQEAVRLRHLDGKSLAEIAETIGRSPDGTAGLLKRGMARLRKLMAEEDEE